MSKLLGSPRPSLENTESKNSTDNLNNHKYASQDDEFHKYFTLGLEEKLRKNPLIKEIKQTFRNPCDISSIQNWENKYELSLPSDLLNFYYSTNGYQCTWSLEHAGELLRIGDLNINQLNDLIPLIKSSPPLDPPKNPPHKTKEQSNNEKNEKNQIHKEVKEQYSHGEIQLMMVMAKSSTPGLDYKGDTRSRLKLENEDKAFRLDSFPHPSSGVNCLVYKNNPKKKTEEGIEIWFEDPEGEFHYLAPTFTHYYRMMLFHLGLPQWHFRFTPQGISNWAEQMCWLVAPTLLQPPKMENYPNCYSGLWSTEYPVEAGKPNTSKNILTANVFKKKKKGNADETNKN